MNRTFQISQNSKGFFDLRLDGSIIAVKLSYDQALASVSDRIDDHDIFLEVSSDDFIHANINGREFRRILENEALWMDKIQ